MSWFKTLGSPPIWIGALLIGLAPPVHAQQATSRWAGIEIGSKGVKSTVLEVDTEPGGGLVFKDVGNGDLPGNILTNLVTNGDRKEFAEDSINKAVQAVAQLRAKANEIGVADDHIYIAVSSGVGDVKAANMNALAERISKLFPTGKPIDVITADLEVKFTFLGVIPQPRDRGKAILVDIGSGNTKFGYVTEVGGQWKKTTAGSVPYGSTTLSEVIEKTLKADSPAFAEYVKAADNVQATEVSPKLVEAAKAIGDRKDRNTIYLTGGASWALAVLQEAWPDANGTPPGGPIVLTRTMVEDFAKKVKDEKAGPPYRITGTGAKPLDEVKRINKVFSAKQLVAAAELLASTYDVFDQNSARVVYTPNSHLAWIRGYVEDKRSALMSKTAAPANLEGIGQSLMELKQELNKERYPKELDDRLKAISDGLATIAANQAKLAERTAPAAVDLTPLLAELRELRKAIKDRPSTPASPATGNSPAPASNDSGVKRDPDKAAEHLLRALEMYHKEKYDLARDHFETAIRLDGQNPAHWFGLSLTQLRLGRTADAKATALRLARFYRADPHSERVVAVAFERIQGRDRNLVHIYIQSELDSLATKNGVSTDR